MAGGGDSTAQNRFAVAIRFGKRLNDEEVSFLPLLLETINKAFPWADVEIVDVRKKPIETRVTLSAVSLSGFSESKVEQLKREIELLFKKLKAAQDVIEMERKEKKSFEERYRSLKEEIFPLILDAAIRSREITDFGVRQQAFMFLDIVGFSQFSEEDRQLQVDVLITLAKAIIGKNKPNVVNTWGDAIVASFEDVNEALRIAVRFSRHLDVEGLDTRISVNWGQVRLKWNELTRRNDFDGDSVNSGARLEQCAEPGEVVCSEGVRFHPSLNEDEFNFREAARLLKKGTEDKKAGDEILLYVVTRVNNSSTSLASREP